MRKQPPKAVEKIIKFVNADWVIIFYPLFIETYRSG
jgi:hypothetical protein